MKKYQEPTIIFKNITYDFITSSPSNVDFVDWGADIFEN